MAYVQDLEQRLGHSGAVYEGNQKHFDLSFLKISIFLTKSVHKLQCNHECNTVMNKWHIVYNWYYPWLCQIIAIHNINNIPYHGQKSDKISYPIG
jgi:hypothetical protein